MESKKKTTDRKEATAPSSTAKLSDDTLGGVQGGAVAPDIAEFMTLYQYVCTICGWKSSWSTIDKMVAATMPHIRETGHRSFTEGDHTSPKD